METVEKEEFWGRVVAAPGEFESLVTADAAWYACAEVVWRVVGGSLVVNGPPMLVAAWEENLGLVPAEGDGLPARKAAILQRLCDMGLPVTVACLEAELARRIGEGMAGVSLSGGTLTVSLALTATEAQIAAAEHVLGRVLPQNLVTEMEWADGLPISYTHVEYLETNNLDNAQFIATGIIPTSDTSCKMRMMSIETTLNHVMFAWATIPNKFAMLWGSSSGLYQVLYLNGQATTWRDSTPPAKQYEWRTFENRKNELWINNVLRKTLNPEDFACDTQLYLFIGNSNVPGGKGLNRCSGFECWTDDGALANYIPALDPTGAPCFYDTVSKKPYYNSGAGDFLYPGKEAEATTYSLRRPLTYAQMTAHGIRRLYHVPRGYNGTREEYAAEHGYKVLVETPAPEEGYWSPVWHETEEEIVLEWVESEPPAEDLM